MTTTDALTADLELKTRAFISLVEEERSPIKSSLSDVPQLRDAYIELRNIARALDQYARANKGLRYIGLMGTFSSGKSSVINSLVGQAVRAADLPPIDDEITILTHPSNRDALMGARSRGLLKVTTQPVEAELLKTCFLVDTPGSGDPEVREGMVRDFLPICDLILYTFSATNALSVPDLSILQTLQDQLDFIPIRFVISRSDEFREDHSLPLSRDNLDEQRMNDFLAHLMARIRGQAPKLVLSADNFFFVDNRANFGIEKLRNSIMTDLESDVHLHSKKIAYFRRGITSQRAIFEEYLSRLIEGVSQLESTAKANKERYENNVVLSFESINNFWRPREGAQTTRTSNFDELAKQWNSVRSRKPVDFGARWLSLPRLQNWIEQRIREFSDDLRIQLIEIGNEELLRRRDELNSQLPTLIRKQGSISGKFIRGDHVPRIATALSPNMMRTLRSAIELARAELLSELRENIRLDMEAFAGLFEHAKRGDILSKEDEYYRDFESMIRANLREFLPIVALFKSAVTSTQARNLIARTGLGARLDILDNVEIDVAAANDHAEVFLQRVFGTRTLRRGDLQASAAIFVERKDVVDASFDDLRQRTNEMTFVRLDATDINALEFEMDQLLRVLLDRSLVAVENELAFAYGVWTDRLKEAQSRFLANLRANRSNVLRGWYERFGGVLGVAAFLGLLAIGGLFITGLQDRLGWSLTILSGALTTATVSVFGWGWRKFSSSVAGLLPKSRWRIAKEIAAQSEPQLEQISIEGTEQLEQIVARAAEEFKSAIIATVSSDRDKLLSRYLSVGEAERALIEREATDVNRYAQQWNALTKAMSDWYRPDELKKRLISEAATTIRERAIEPALTLFAERLRDVRNFYDRLRSLVF